MGRPTWFSKAEARQWLPADPVVGAKQELPPRLVQRMACLHLVDTARGQSLPFETGQVAGSRIVTEVVGRDGSDTSMVRLRIHGSTKAQAAGRTMRIRMRGLARFDLKSGRFVEFELVALGVRTGGTQFNGRGREPGPSRVGFLFRLAPAGWRVPPAFVNFYQVDWVKTPTR